MTRDEALTIVGMIANHWPGNQWTEGGIDAYARAIEPLDADTTMTALTRCVAELEFYPKVAVLRDYVKMAARAAAYDAAREEAVEAQRMPSDVPAARYETPEWVRGWFVARLRHDDFRVWPQQDPLGGSVDPMPREAQAQYLEEGRPLKGLRPLDIVNALTLKSY